MAMLIKILIKVFTIFNLKFTTTFENKNQLKLFQKI